MLGICAVRCRPEWEDSANAAGGEWSCRDRFRLHNLDTFWENLVLGLIGETIDFGDEVSRLQY